MSSRSRIAIIGGAAAAAATLAVSAYFLHRRLKKSSAPTQETTSPSVLPATLALSDTPAAQSKVLYVLRGVSGSGKSTLAVKLLQDHADCKELGVIYSSDDFFMRNPEGEYRWAAHLLEAAHRWNQSRTEAALAQGISPVIVDNTHTVKWEAKPYVESGLKFGYEIRFVEPSTPWARDAEELAKRNKHNVPLISIQRMLSRWESDFTVESVMASQPPARVIKSAARYAEKKKQRQQERDQLQSPSSPQGRSQQEKPQQEQSGQDQAPQDQPQQLTQHEQTDKEAPEELKEPPKNAYPVIV